MSKPRNPKKIRCGRCEAVEKVAVRRTQFYKGVLIENLPATYCLNCGEELYSLKTAELMEKIAAQTQQYAKMVEMPVARVA
jgi:YgiT-type zinc finger domain-containing protein